MKQKYEEFSKAAHLRTQPERMKAYVPPKKAVDNIAERGIINTKRMSTRINSRGEVLNPMDKSEYDRITGNLRSQGIEIAAVTGGDDLRYMLEIGAEGSYSGGRISHIGEIPSRGTLFEEMIHMAQERRYGEMALGDYTEYYAREIEANRKLLRYRESYRLDVLDVEDAERNLRNWEVAFLRRTGVSYDDSHYRG